MNTKLLNEVHTLAKHMRQKCPQLREGQSLMNALHEIDDQLYSQINQTDADCFYVDANIAKFWDAIVNH
jgi:hypothetical protein